MVEIVKELFNGNPEKSKIEVNGTFRFNCFPVWIVVIIGLTLLSIKDFVAGHVRLTVRRPLQGNVHRMK